MNNVKNYWNGQLNTLERHVLLRSLYGYNKDTSTHWEDLPSQIQNKITQHYNDMLTGKHEQLVYVKSYIRDGKRVQGYYKRVKQ